MRAAAEATVRCIKHPFPTAKSPVRGLFRMTCLVVTSAVMTNVRRIQRYRLRNRSDAPQREETRPGWRIDCTSVANAPLLSGRSHLARLAGALAAVMSDDALRARLGSAALALSRSFEWVTIARQHLEAYGLLA